MPKKKRIVLDPVMLPKLGISVPHDKLSRWYAETEDGSGQLRIHHDPPYLPGGERWTLQYDIHIEGVRVTLINAAPTLEGAEHKLLRALENLSQAHDTLERLRV